MGHRKPIRTAIPVLQQFFAIVDATRETYHGIRLSRDSLCRWRSGKRSPYLQDFWETAYTLGYDLVLVPRPAAGSTSDTPQPADCTPSSEGTHAATAAPAA